jgi:hypothetical protein
MPVTIFFSTAAAARTRSSHRTGDAKKTVRINYLFAILQLSRSPFFQLNRCVWVERAIGDISSHRPSFAPTLPPPARIYHKEAATQNKTVRNDCVSIIIQFFYSPFFSIKLLFLGPTRDP